jgi:UDP-N-acetylglucosamine:LPS N-acetylglucosamine transferase
LNDVDLAERLARDVRDLLGDPARLAGMRTAARAAAMPGAAANIVRELAQLSPLSRGGARP